MKFCLGIEVARDRINKIITMSQLGYINKIAERFGLTDCKPSLTPADSNSVLIKKDPDEERIEVPYRAIIGSLMYAMVCTRPDIANAVANVARYSDDPSHDHWSAAKRVLRYLVTTKHAKLVFGSRPSEGLEGYADANWASDVDTRRSTTGYVFKLFGTAVSWKSQRQHTVATSSTEAEYMALYAATQEVIWLRRMLLELQVIDEVSTRIWQDNQGAIALAKNPIMHARTKHIDIKYHFTRNLIEDGVIVIEYKPTQDMVADALTKAVNKVKLKEFVINIGMKDEVSECASLQGNQDEA
jgi:hypothetical protein